MIAAVSLLLLSAGDPRPGLVALQLEGRQREALVVVERTLEEAPDEARRQGLDYLRGHLLEVLGRSRDAHQAFAMALGTSPELTGYSRYRLAVNQYRMGHPEVAAGLLATLLANQPPPPLVPEAGRLLVRSLEAGGDCRLLGGLDGWRIPTPERRALELVRAECALDAGQADRAAELLWNLLAEAIDDEVARRAANRLTGLGPAADMPLDLKLLLGRTFHHHREFQLAIRYLELGLEHARRGGGQGAGQPKPDQLTEAGYALARSFFWEGDYATAAERFGDLVDGNQGGDEAARALYQQGRSHELRGDWNAAADSYQRSFDRDPTSQWASPALISRLRVEWRTGAEALALELHDQLHTRRSWRKIAGRASLFLASSDLVRRRADRAGAWLDLAERSGGVAFEEIAYWRGRHAELESAYRDAVRHYARLLRRDPYHPLAQAAVERLAGPPLSGMARALGLTLAGSEVTSDLHDAWLLLGDGHPRGAAAREHLLRHLEKSERARAFLELTVTPPADWPLWQARIHQPEEVLLALGILEQGSASVQKHFPVARASLGYTGSSLLAWAGLTQRSLYVAEVLAKRAPPELPARLLPDGYRRLLYPDGFAGIVAPTAARFGVDPDLLTAIIREESRFDPLVVSSASARGLTQFVLPTARRLVSRLGLDELEPADLHRPEVSIALGAAYLAELGERFAGRTHQVVAAYNAGEDQALLWQSYCYSTEPEEYFSKVGFPQTRGYLTKVLSSRAQYREIYARAAPPSAAAPPAE